MVGIAKKRTLTLQIFDVCGRVKEKDRKDKGTIEVRRQLSLSDARCLERGFQTKIIQKRIIQGQKLRTYVSVCRRKSKQYIGTASYTCQSLERDKGKVREQMRLRLQNVVRSDPFSIADVTKGRLADEERQLETQGHQCFQKKFYLSWPVMLSKTNLCGLKPSLSLTSSFCCNSPWNQLFHWSAWHRSIAINQFC